MYEKMEELKDAIKNCNKCKLCKNRKNIVFGEGFEKAQIMFIGEGPGADEDTQGIPFVGKAGKLMDKAFEICRNRKRRSIYCKHSKMQTAK